MNRRIEKTRASIKKAFLELIVKEDFEKVTITEICQKADINRITYYDHYKDKYELLNSIFIDLDNESKLNSAKMDLENNKNHDPYTSVSNYLLCFVSALTMRKELVLSIANKSSGYIYFAFISFLNIRFKELVTYTIDEKNLRCPVDQTSSFVVGGITSFIITGIKIGKYPNDNFQKIFYDSQDLVRNLLHSQFLKK